jgi:arylsulfatase A-like enzyme
LLAKRWPWLLAAGVLIAVVLATLRVHTPGDWDTRPLGTVQDIAKLRERSDLNVLFLVIDTLRAERLGAYGYGRDTSPNLDRLARTGVRFEHQTSQSTWTKSSMVSLWTGLYPVRTGISRYDDVIPPQAKMPAEVLRDAGFQTVGLWRNGWVSPTFGFDQGFDVYQRPLPAQLPPNVRRANPTLTDKSTDQSLIDGAVEFVRIDGGKRWFLYMHMMDLHEYIYDQESALFGSTHSDLYDNSIRWTDGSIELLLERLAELGQLDKTLVVITSDHGEAFLERGFEGHAREVYRETTEVPFLLLLPFRLEPGVVVKARTQNVDVWPTVFDLLGLPPPAASDGRSLVPEIVASASGKDTDGAGGTAIADLDQTWARRDLGPAHTIAVVKDGFRYVRMRRPDETNFEQLFNSKEDPREFRDRSADDPETLKKLREVAEDYLTKKPDWGEAPTRDIDELELNLLRALGYKVE